MFKHSLRINNSIILRMPDVDFTDELFEIIQSENDYLKKWLSWIQGLESQKDVFDFLRTARLFNIGGQKLISFVFFENQLVGSVALSKISVEHNCAELGYWISQHFQGKGIISQSCTGFLDYVFEEKKLNRVEINVQPKNKKSIAVAEKLNFKFEGTSREILFLNNEYHDLSKYSLLKSEWKL